LKVNGSFVPNPLVVTDRWVDPASGKIAYGEAKTGEEKAAGKALLKEGTVDLSPLDEAVDRLVTGLLQTFPNCLMKTIESIRKHKLAHWDRNKETNRQWLGLNMLTEAQAGFRAFDEGEGRNREVDFALLRQRLAEGEKWGPDLIDAIQPKKPVTA
jgi:6-oxo-cyclohex-1-ene-carbonyl-CoA hydrolase